MLPKFELYMPEDLREACRLKAEGAKPVSGGTDVYVNMHAGKDVSDRVVDLKGLRELQGQRFTEEGLDLGALTTHRRMETWDVIRRHYHALYQGCSQVGSVQIRCRGTLGGNIMNGAPSADSVGPLLVHGAQVAAAGPAGARYIPLEAFYVGFKAFDLGPEELLTRIRVPLPPENAGSAYYKYTRRGAMDLALLGVSAYVELEGGVIQTARIALTTAGPTPMRSRRAEAVLTGRRLTDELLVRAAEAVEAEGKPRSSWRSSAAFRRRLLHDVTILVLHEAVRRAQKPWAEKGEPIPAALYPGLTGARVKEEE